MTATATLPPLSWRPRRRWQPHRLAVLALIAVLHGAAVAALFVVRDAPLPPPPAPQALMVSFIQETPPPAAPTPPPPKPVPPKPQPKMVATPKPTPSPLQAPPLDEAPADAEPVDEAPPSPPAPPAAAAPAAPEVVPPDFVAAYLNNPGPSYPSTSIRLREQGTVLLLVLVNADGRADKVTVDKSSGYARLDEAAADVVRKRWRFVPAKQGGQPVSAWVKVPVTFELSKKH
ncbi:energy transducer TonB [Solimonas variicoloris]|uniref:energy transducer TonB n=1 Tax=Solimonas variicoloris TaxID=254408 RepID=UPI000376A857|nr:energy transducer TonB [Solimonas variicoloris]